MGAINNHTINQTEKKIIPLRYSLTNYDFNNLMNQSITEKLSTIKWLHLNKKQITTKLSTEEKKQLPTHIEKIGDVLIHVDLSYKLSETFMDTLIVKAKVTIYKKEPQKNIVIYRNTFDYLEQIKIPQKPKTHIDVWSENDGAAAKKSMNLAIKLLPEVIAKDIIDSNNKFDNKKPTNIWYSRGMANPGNLAAYLEQKIGNRYVIRTKSGNIIIANQRLVTQKHNWRE